MRNSLAAALTLLLHSPAFGQTVPDGVHGDANGTSNICGVDGGNALAIRKKLRSDPHIAERASGSDRFETYFSSSEAKQWTFTTRRDAAYPAVTCVSLSTSGQGTDMQRQMRCDAGRAACDALFLEFEASDKKLREQIRGR